MSKNKIINIAVIAHVDAGKSTLVDAFLHQSGTFRDNEVVKDLDKSIITLVAIKPNSEVDTQFIEVKEGQIYADLKPSMCDLVGNYQAKAIIALEGEIVTTDTISYSVNEDKIISKLNDDVVSDERFTLFTDALTRLSTIEISEEQRVINEAERILSEENRKI